MGTFQAAFGRDPALSARAHGRANLMGEHTDYNGGCVLPAAIPLLTRVDLAPRSDRRARIWSAALSAGAGPATWVLGSEARSGSWLDYPQGVTWALGASGYAIAGFDACITSSLPPGGGLASSAALQVALLRALSSAFALPLGELDLALVAQRAESEFVGARVGIMDQLAAGLAEPGAALFIDTRTLERRSLSLPVAAELVVIDSGVRHAHSSGGYNARRTECDEAAVLLGVDQICQLGVADLDRLAALPEPWRRRARHVITENRRVQEAVAALAATDLDWLGELFMASHVSQRDDYAVSIPEVDLLVELAVREPAIVGARLSGGGWGGCVVALARAGEARSAGERVAEAYSARSGRRGILRVPDTT